MNCGNWIIINSNSNSNNNNGNSYTQPNNNEIHRTYFTAIVPFLIALFLRLWVLSLFTRAHNSFFGLLYSVFLCVFFFVFFLLHHRFGFHRHQFGLHIYIYTLGFLAYITSQLLRWIEKQNQAQKKHQTKSRAIVMMACWFHFHWSLELNCSLHKNARFNLRWESEKCSTIPSQQIVCIFECVRMDGWHFVHRTAFPLVTSNTPEIWFFSH